MIFYVTEDRGFGIYAACCFGFSCEGGEWSEEVNLVPRLCLLILIDEH